jgi:hypothetical protein
MSETLIETVQLDSEENNELLFKVNVEGHVSGPAKVRLVCESNDVEFMFPGRPAGDEGLVQFVLHKSAGLKPGTYPSRIEVLIENRYFVPVEFNIELKKTVQVFVEAVNRPTPVKKNDVQVSAVPVVSSKPTPLVIEGHKKTLSVKSITLADMYKQKRVK